MTLYTDFGPTPFQKCGKHGISRVLKQVCKLKTIHIPTFQMKKRRLRELSDVPKVIEGIA